MLSSWNKVIIVIIIIISDYAHAGVQCFLVESYSLLLKNIVFFLLSSFLQVKWCTQEEFNHDNKYWRLELATGPDSSVGRVSAPGNGTYT